MLQAVDLTIRLHPQDDVVIARTELPAGTLVQKENVRAAVRIPAGHKIAVRAVAQGAPVHRYNQIIGFATQPIAPVCESRTVPCSSTGTSPISLIARYSGVRVSPPKKSTKRGSQRAPQSCSVSAAL